MQSEAKLNKRRIQAWWYVLSAGMITLSRDTETKITDLLGDMFKTNYYRGCYDVQSILGVEFNVSKVDVKMLQRILKHPWSGKNYSQALWENTDKLATLAKRELTMGFMNGSSVQKMAKEINDVMGKGRYAAERLVRTESSYFSNQGELASYREMGIQEYTFLGGGFPCKKQHILCIGRYF